MECLQAKEDRFGTGSLDSVVIYEKHANVDDDFEILTMSCDEVGTFANVKDVKLQVNKDFRCNVALNMLKPFVSKPTVISKMLKKE